MLVIWFPAFLDDRIHVGVHKPRHCYFSIGSNRAFALAVMILGYHLPSCLMVFCYVRIYRIVRLQRAKVAPVLRHTSVRSVELQTTTASLDARLRDDKGTSTKREDDLATNSRTVSAVIPRKAAPTKGGEREARIFRSLSYIVTAYLVLWTPTHIIGDIGYFNISLLSDDIINYVSILCYFNSAVNPLLYAASCEHTRHAMCRVLRFNRP